MQNKDYENYIPIHLDDPKYVGNFELSTVVTVFLSVFFSVVAYVKGRELIAVIIMSTAIIYFKLKAKFENFLDGWLYWAFGFVKLPKKERKIAREFGVVPTFVRDFEE